MLPSDKNPCATSGMLKMDSWNREHETSQYRQAVVKIIAFPVRAGERCKVENKSSKFSPQIITA